ncbi:MAG: cytochrome c biogenesis protein CcsA [Anaerolineae bacterium]
MLLAAGALAVSLTYRGVRSGHWPLSNQYEFTLGFALIMACECLIVTRVSHRGAWVGVGLVLLALLLRAVTMPVQARMIGPLSPVLRSVWLQAHVLTVMVGYASFGVAAGFSLSAILLRRENTELRTLALYVVELGFPWLTLGILAGAMWAQNAWGRYWGWDPKETWSLITWLWYLMILHLSPGDEHQGMRQTFLMLVGFALVMFTFVGVPALARLQSLPTLHGY